MIPALFAKISTGHKRWHDIDMVIAQIIMIDGREAVATDDELFDGVECFLVSFCPARPLQVCTLHGERCEDASVVCKVW